MELQLYPSSESSSSESSSWSSFCILSNASSNTFVRSDDDDDDDDDVNIEEEEHEDDDDNILRENKEAGITAGHVSGREIVLLPVLILLLVEKGKEYGMLEVKAEASFETAVVATALLLLLLLLLLLEGYVMVIDSFEDINRRL